MNETQVVVAALLGCLAIGAAVFVFVGKRKKKSTSSSGSRVPGTDQDQK